MTETDFWASTPYQTRLALEAHGEALERMDRLLLTCAWQTAKLTRIKKLPPLKRFLPPPKSDLSDRLAASLRAYNLRQLDVS